MNKKIIGFDYEGQRWFYEPIANLFIGPSRNIKPFHPLFCKLEAARDGRNVVSVAGEGDLKLGAL